MDQFSAFNLVPTNLFLCKGKAEKSFSLLSVFSNKNTYCVKVVLK